MNEKMDAYRTQLIDAEQKAQEDYDKTVLTLSGGALGVSFAFVKDILPSDSVVSQSILLLAWICWTLSIAFVLASHFSSQLALRKAISQVDEGTIRVARTGGIYDLATALFNFLDGALFIAGALLMICFALANLGGVA